MTNTTRIKEKESLIRTNNKSSIINDIFIHFLDHQILESQQIKLTSEKSVVYKEFRLAIRLALLLCENSIIIPVSNYFENLYSKKLLSEYSNFGELGYIQFVSGALNFGEFLHDKKIQYQKDKKIFPVYFKEGALFLPSNGKWLVREQSSTKDIKSKWITSIGDQGKWENVYKFTNFKKVSDFEESLNLIPEKLGNQAFIPNFVLPFVKSSSDKLVKARLNLIITNSYIESFTNEYDAYCLADLTTFDTNIYIKDVTKKISFVYWKRRLQFTGLLNYIESCSTKDLLLFKQSQSWRDILQHQEFLLFPTKPFEAISISNMAEKLFISYSHKDEEFKNRFDEGLSVLKRQNKIDVWQDQELIAGKDFEEDIFKFLNISKIICILVSPSFVNSNYCYSTELQIALERHNRKECSLLPIIIRPTPSWHQLPFAKIMALPKDGKAVTEWENADKAWENVITQIDRLLTHINSTGGVI